MSTAIPSHLDKALWPFTHETSVSAIREAVADYDDRIAINRRCAGFWLRHGDRAQTTEARRQIDRLAAARRNGLARIAALTARGMA